MNPVPTAIEPSVHHREFDLIMFISSHHAPGKCASNAADSDNKEKSEIDVFYKRKRARLHVLSVVCNIIAFPKPIGICRFLVNLMRHGGKYLEKSQCRTMFAIDPSFRE